MAVPRAICFALLAFVLVDAASAQGRRVRLRPRPVIQDEQLQYYEADERAGDEDVVVVSPVDDLALYGRQAARADNYIRPAATKQSHTPRTKESKAPPVQTIRNYNKVNDDGSFTFGYEAADGSFKEETRGTDCVVRGKYGYVDPDGNKREFTYVSGNPCDPNAQGEDDDPEDLRDRDSDRDSPNEPANYPSRPPRPLPQRPQVTSTTPRPTTTVFQNVFRQQALESDDDDEPPRTLPPRPRPTSTPLAITPRPQLPATTFRPVLQIAQRIPQVTQRPIVYTSAAPSPSPSVYASSSPKPAGHIDFAAEFAKFQNENQIVSSTPASYKTKSKTSEPSVPGSSTGNPIYSTQLVYDPSSGQYNSQLYQTLPQANGEFTLNHPIQPSVTLPRYTQQPQQPQGFSPSPLYRHRLQHPQPQFQAQLRPQELRRPQEIRVPQELRSPQELYQRQQNEQLYSNSQQLYLQQQQLQQSQLQADRQAARAALGQVGLQSQPQQQFYYVAPGRESQQPGQIDSFLRGHGIQF